MFYFAKKGTKQSSTKKVSLRYLRLNFGQELDEDYINFGQVKLYNLLRRREKAHSFDKENNSMKVQQSRPQTKRIRRKSCHCAECGQLSKFQNKCMFDCPLVNRNNEQHQMNVRQNFDRRDQLRMAIKKTCTFLRISPRRVTHNWDKASIKSTLLQAPIQTSYQQLDLLQTKSCRMETLQSPRSTLSQTQSFKSLNHRRIQIIPPSPLSLVTNSCKTLQTEKSLTPLLKGNKEMSNQMYRSKAQTKVNKIFMVQRMKQNKIPFLEKKRAQYLSKFNSMNNSNKLSRFSINHSSRKLQ